MGDIVETGWEDPRTAVEKDAEEENPEGASPLLEEQIRGTQWGKESHWVKKTQKQNDNKQIKTRDNTLSKLKYKYFKKK